MGLVGGLGVGATVHYYQALARALEKLGKPLRLIMVHADMRRVLAAAQAKQLDELAEYLASLIQQLKSGGADLAAVSAVTPHICFEQLIPRSALPLVNLLAVVRPFISGKRVALFGTRFSIETDLFGTLAGENTIRPRSSEVEQIHEVYVRTAARGEGSQEDRELLSALAKTLIHREGLESIVFAGTDLALLFDPSNTTFPCIDCARLHIEAIMKQLVA